MQRSLVVCGVSVFLIGLGFVCPQIANLRDSGALFTWQVLLLGLGVSLAVVGVLISGTAANSLVSRRRASGER
jgi:hypothetical protein